MNRILVTGSKGQLANDVFDFFSNSPFELIGKTHNQLDITNLDSVVREVSREEPNWIINCAAYTDLDAAESNARLAFEVNFEGPRNLAEVSSSYNIGLIHISTDAVFSSELPIYFDVSEKPNPINVYGVSKVLGEQAIRDLAKKYWILRSSWIYGHKGSKYFNSVLTKIRNSQNIDVVTDQYGQPTPTFMLSSAIREIVSNKIDIGTHHIVPSEYISRYEFCLKIKQAYELVNDKISKSHISRIVTKRSNFLAPRTKYSLLRPSEFIHLAPTSQDSSLDRIIEVMRMRERSGGLEARGERNRRIGDS